MIAALRNSRHASLISGGLFFAFMALVPLLLNIFGVSGGGSVQLGALNDIGIYLILALSLNVILGHTGLFHMGHTAFFAVGAYTAAILNTVYGWPILTTMPVAGALAAVFAVLVALPTIHLRGDYLLVVTIGLVQIVFIALVNDVGGLTGGANGIAGISRAEIFGVRLVKPWEVFYLIWGFAAVTVVLFYLLEHSRFGRALNYIKHDDLAAAGCGIDITSYKIKAFALGAFWAGMAGTLFSVKMRLVDPQSFTFSESVMLFAIVILGGSGSIAGVILGAFLLIGLQEAFRDFQEARMLLFGGAMVAMMIFRPQGLLPARRRIYEASRFLGKFPKAVQRGGNRPASGSPSGNEPVAVRGTAGAVAAGSGIIARRALEAADFETADGVSDRHNGEGSGLPKVFDAESGAVAAQKAGEQGGGPSAALPCGSMDIPGDDEA